MKKIIANLLLLILIFTMVSGCGGQSDPDDVIDGENKRDLLGRSIIWRSSYSENTVLGYGENTLFADVALERRKNIEQELNFEFDFRTEEYYSMKTNLLAASMTGDVYADVCFSVDEVLKSVMFADLLMPISDLSDEIDLTDNNKWGTYGVLETMMMDSVIYAVRPSLWPERFADFYTPIIFNSKLTSQGGHADPREYYEKGDWSNELFVQMIQDCTVKGQGTDIVGLTTSQGFFYQMALLANNAYMYKKVDGNYVNATNEKAYIDALEWVQGVITDYADCLNLKPDWVGMNAPFYAETAAMVMYPTWGIFSGFAMQIKDWGLLPFPNGANREYGDWAAYYDGNGHFVSVPILAEEPLDVAYMLNELFEPLDNYNSYENLMDYYKHNLFFDERDFNLFFKLSNNAKYNYWFEGGNPVVASISSSNVTPVQAVTRSKGTVDEMIEKYIAGNQKFFEDLESNS